MGHPADATNTEKGTQPSHIGSGKQVPWWRQRRVLVFLSFFAAVIVVLLIVIIVALTAGHHSVPNTTGEPICNNTEGPTQMPEDPELTLPDGRWIARRSEWSSESPGFKRPLYHPTPYVVIGHTAETACRGPVQCFPLLRIYRDQHRTQWAQPDISYNFLIDVDGHVYEGRGWDATNNLQSWVLRCNLFVGLMGNFMTDSPTAAMLRSLQQLLELGVTLGKLDPDYRLVANSQVLATLSPGTNVLQEIDTWPHRCLHDCDVGVQCVYEGMRDYDA